MNSRITIAHPLSGRSLGFLKGVVEMKKYLLATVGVFLAFFGLSAHAVIDTTGFTTGLSDASVALVACFVALIAFLAGMIGYHYVTKFVGRKSGI